jgi:hypothetical protein
MRGNGAFVVPHLQLENQLMNAHGGLKYIEASALVRQARADLGMSKHEPVTDELRLKTEELLAEVSKSRLNVVVPRNGSAIDAESTTTPQTVQMTYSYDNSEDSHPRNDGVLARAQGTASAAAPAKTVSILKNKGTNTTNNHSHSKNVGIGTSVPYDDTEASTFAEDGDGGASTVTNATKKRSKLLLARLFRVGRKSKVAGRSSCPLS